MLGKRNSIVAAIPCYNESENLPALFEKFNQLSIFYETFFKLIVVVIDDASTDPTQTLVAEAQKRKEYHFDLRYIRHEQNRGLKGGLLTAVHYFCDLNTTENQAPLALCIMDGDNSHNPLTIPTLFQKYLDGYDVVVASRFQPGSKVMGVVWWRQLLSAGMALLFKGFRNISGVRDYSCGYRLYSRQIILELVRRFGNQVVTEPNFACMVELLLNCKLAGAVMTEVPFLLRYDLKQGESKMRFLATIRGTLRVLSRRKKAPIVESNSTFMDCIQ